MPGLSNGALIGLSVSVVTATAVTVAAVNGVFDPLFDRNTTVVASAPDERAPADASAAGQDRPAADEPAEAITPRKKPKIDIVRVEPTGDAVIAGQSDAGALVAVLSNGVVVGKGVANETGDWAIVIEDPLAPGSHDIIVEARKDDSAEPVTSDDMVAVHIPENESDGVFVATNRPGAPTEVLQAPPRQRTQMADRVEDGEETVSARVRPEGEKVATAAGPAIEGRREDAAARSDDAVTDGGRQRPASPAAEAPAKAEPAVAKPDAPVDVARAEPPSGSVAAGAPETKSPAAPEPDAVAQAEPERPAEQPDAAAETVPPAAAEVATAGERQREPAPTVAEEVRPEPEAAPTATAGAQPEVEAEPAPAATAVARAQPPAAAPSDAGPAQEPIVTVEAVEAERGQIYVAGQSSGDGAVRVYIEDKLIGVARPNRKGQWLVTAPETVGPGRHNVRADKVEDDKGTVSARAEVVFERDPDEVALKRIAVTTSGASDVATGAEVDAGRREIPAMIIRKGDNLWRISRRHYGKGIRYTTIYQANQDQIRDPDLIYPGQVFLLPERDLNWANN